MAAPRRLRARGFAIVKRTDRSSPKLMLAAASGQRFRCARLEISVALADAVTGRRVDGARLGLDGGVAERRAAP